MNYELLVNKANCLDKDYIPTNLVDALSKYKEGITLEEKVVESFRKMQMDAKRYDYDIDIMSGYRPYEYQLSLYNNLIKEKGFNYALRKIAKPGCSEHQTGLALDFCVYKDNKCYIEGEIEDFAETKWVHTNAHKYGFILRYPDNKEEITGYNYEPWHLRYIGDLAIYLYNNDLTLEEFYERKGNN